MKHPCCNGEDCVFPGGFEVNRPRKECPACIRRKSEERWRENSEERSSEVIRDWKIKENQKDFSEKPKELSKVVTPYKKWEKKLDIIVSQYTKWRDTEHDGSFVCISCQEVKREGENGHYYRRGIVSVRWDEINNNRQCIECNREKEGNVEEYRKGLILRYGLEAVLELDDRAKATVKYKPFELEEIYKYYLEKMK